MFTCKHLNGVLLIAQFVSIAKKNLKDYWNGIGLAISIAT